MTDQERGHLAQADRHIAECKGHIARQKERIQQIAQSGQSTVWAEDMLEALQTSLRAFERHRKLIVAQMDAKPLARPARGATMISMSSPTAPSSAAPSKPLGRR
jgi:pyridoxal biosynthesis lyase PdxS